MRVNVFQAAEAVITFADGARVEIPDVVIAATSVDYYTTTFELEAHGPYFLRAAPKHRGEYKREEL